MKNDALGAWKSVAAGLLLALAAAPAGAQTDAAAMDDKWHFAVVPYFWFTGLEGTVSVRGLPEVPFDQSFTDLMEDFDIGLQGRFEARKNRVGLAFDLMYINLGVPVSGRLGGQADLHVDIRQLVTEGFAFYRVRHGGRSDNPSYVDVLAGARYFGTSTQLENDALETSKQTLSWVDGLAGLRFRAPLGAKFALLGHGDVAGFGSDFTWTLSGDLVFRVSDRWHLGAGWQHLDIDYDSGEDRDRKRFDLVYDGPRVWGAYAW